MSAVAQNHLLEVLKNHCSDIGSELGAPSYRTELLKTLTEILSVERSNMVQPTQIQRKVADKVETLGKIIAATDWAQSEEEA